MPNGKPVLFVENVYSRLQFPGHVITPSDEQVNFETFRVANGRRSPFDYASPVTANAIWIPRVAYDRVRAINAVALDRGHNLGGFELSVRTSSDAWVTEYVAATSVIPTTSSSGSVDELNGVRTEEGAWFKRFPQVESMASEVRVPAMGAGLKPKVVGLQLGYAWECEYWTRPVGEGGVRLAGEVVESGSAWRARTTPTRQRVLTLKLKLVDYASYDAARYHLEGHFASGRPMWLVLNQDQADRAIQVEVEGPIGFNYETDYGYQQCTFACVEHGPLRAL